MSWRSTPGDRWCFTARTGFSVKSAEGQASYYYSQPFYDVAGRLELPGGAVQVTGQAWLDREYSSQPLSENQMGWDWVSFHLDSGEKLMGFQLRQTDGRVYTAASWITPEGDLTAFQDGALTMTPLETAEMAGRTVPVRWRVELPARSLDVEIAALNPAKLDAHALFLLGGPGLDHGAAMPGAAIWR
jgi:predicted secreted hydrolase